MGWGLLFFGYFLEYILGMNAMFAPFVHVIGCALMIVGANGLSRYCRSFKRVWVSAWALMVPAVLRTLVDLNALFAWNIPFVGGILKTAVYWANLYLMVLFHVFLALAVKELALRVGVSKNAVRAVRNLVMMAIYVVLVLIQTIFPVESVLRVLYPVTLLVQLIWVICNCVMLYSCYMRIAPANESDTRPPSRFAFVNRMRAAFESHEQKAIDADRAYHAENARRANEKRMARSSRKQAKKRNK